MNKKYFWYLIGLYLLFSLVKSVLSYFISTPTMFNDEYLFAKMARSFFYNLNLHVGGEPISWGRPLYPIIISISYFFKNNFYLAMKIINSFLSSLVILPAYLLAREFFSNKKSILIAILISVLPMNFAFSSYIMSENIFYVLFLFSIYFIYKTLNENEIKWAIFAGLFIGLCNLTRLQGLIFFPLIVILFLVKKKIKFLLYILGISLIVIAPYYLLNVYYLGFTLRGVLGYKTLLGGRLPFSVFIFIFWCLFYFSHIILSSGIFSFLAKFDLKNNLLFILSLSLLFLIFIAAFHVTTFPFKRPIGRYIDAVIPGILILGLFNLKNDKKSSFLQILLVFGFVLFSFKLLNYSLFPINHLMLSHLGVINSIFGKIIAGILILGSFFCYFLIKKLTIKRVVLLLSLFFIMISFLCYGINFYNASYRWYPLDQIQSGLWLNKLDNDPNKIVFIEKVDEESSSKLPRNQPLLIAGFWINSKVITDKIDNLNSYEDIDYIFSINELKNFEFIQRFGDIRIYKNI